MDDNSDPICGGHSRPVEDTGQGPRRGLVGGHTAARQRGQHRAMSTPAAMGASTGDHASDEAVSRPAARSESYMHAVRVAQREEGTPASMAELERAVLDVLQVDAVPANSVREGPTLGFGTRCTALIHLYRYDN